MAKTCALEGYSYLEGDVMGGRLEILTSQHRNLYTMTSMCECLRNDIGLLTYVNHGRAFEHLHLANRL